LKRAVFPGIVLAMAVALLASCGGYSSPNTRQTGTGLAFRAFVSQDVSAGGVLAGLNIINASNDKLARITGVQAGGRPGLMEVSNNKAKSLVFDSSNNSVNIVNNKQESSAGSIALPGATESMAITADASFGYAAVPTAPVAMQGTGAVEMLNLSSGAIVTSIPVQGARFVSLSPDGTHLLAFSNVPQKAADNSDTATLITLTNTGTSSSPVWSFTSSAQVSGLDRPVWAVFSADSSTAYILNCGAECGGTAAGVAVLALNNNPSLTLTTTLPLPGGATHGTLFGPTLYVAGSTPGTGCGGTNTTAPFCGTLSVVDITNPSAPQLANSVTITDGYHDRVSLTSDNHVFMGAKGCSLPTDATEQRGCLSIFNAAKNSVIIGTDPGDVTGIAPVTGRNEVYVIQNGEFRIWDTVKDALSATQIDLTGQMVDVKIVD
jgi:hypothetical protein